MFGSIRAWYLNEKRILECLDPQSIKEYSDFMGGLSEQVRFPIRIAKLGKICIEIIKKNQVPPLEVILHKEGHAIEKNITLDARFYSHGLAMKDQKKSNGIVTLKTTIETLKGSVNVRMEFHKSNIASETGVSSLMGSPHLFVFGYIKEIKDKTIIITPYVIGDLLKEEDSFFSPNIKDVYSIHPSRMEIFKNVNFSRKVSLKQLEALKNVPEANVKKLFCELLGIIPENDWGGESCDIYCKDMLIDEKNHVSAAFLLKGPSRFKKMYLKDCGKNGDQIPRLFDSSATLCVLQHCHSIDPSVIKTLTAFTRADLSSKRFFSVINGFDTWNILKHYKILK